MIRILEARLSIKLLIIWIIIWILYFNTSRKNQGFTQLKQTPKFSSVYYTGLSRVFSHFLRKTGAILFLMNVRNNNLRTTSIETVTIEICDVHQHKILKIWKLDINKLSYLKLFIVGWNLSWFHWNSRISNFRGKLIKSCQVSKGTKI